MSCNLIEFQAKALIEATLSEARALVLKPTSDTAFTTLRDTILHQGGLLTLASDGDVSQVEKLVAAADETASGSARWGEVKRLIAKAISLLQRGGPSAEAATSAINDQLGPIIREVSDDLGIYGSDKEDDLSWWRESIDTPSRISDPQEAYLRISSQIYNGGIEQLIENEGGNFRAVRAIIDMAGMVATISQSWPNAVAYMTEMLETLEGGQTERDEWGNQPDSMYTQEALDSVEEAYMPLVHLLEKIDKDLDVDNWPDDF